METRTAADLIADGHLDPRDDPAYSPHRDPDDLAPFARQRNRVGIMKRPPSAFAPASPAAIAIHSLSKADVIDILADLVREAQLQDEGATDREVMAAILRRADILRQPNARKARAAFDRPTAKRPTATGPAQIPAAPPLPIGALDTVAELCHAVIAWEEPGQRQPTKVSARIAAIALDVMIPPSATVPDLIARPQDFPLPEDADQLAADLRHYRQYDRPLYRATRKALAQRARAILAARSRPAGAVTLAPAH